MNDSIKEKIENFEEVYNVYNRGEYKVWADERSCFDIYINTGTKTKYVIVGNGNIKYSKNDFYIGLDEYLNAVNLNYISQTVSSEQDLKPFLLKLNEIINIHPDIKDIFNIPFNKEEVYL